MSACPNRPTRLSESVTVRTGVRTGVRQTGVRHVLLYYCDANTLNNNDTGNIASIADLGASPALRGWD